MSDRTSAPAADVVVPAATGLLAAGLLGTSGRAAGLATLLLAVGLASRARVRTGCLACSASVALGGAALAVAALPLPSTHIAHHAAATRVTFEGRVRASEADRGGRRLEIDAHRLRDGDQWRSVHGRVALRIARVERDWAPGTGVRVRVRLRRPRNFGNPGEYDYAGALARRGVFATGFAWDERDVAPVAVSPRWGQAMRHGVREHLRRRIARAGTPRAVAFLRTVLLGERRAMEEGERRALVRAGLAHVAAVSGFHLAVVAGGGVLLLGWVVRRSEWITRRSDARKLAVAGGVFPALVYYMLAGGHLPASRAVSMYAAACFAVWVDRPGDPLRVLAAVACAMLLPDPRWVLDPSFGLSFASVLAIVLVVSGPTVGSSPLLRVVVEPMRVTVAAWLATLPLVAHHFQEISLVAPVANLLILPLLGPGTLVPGLLALPAALIPGPAADVLLRLAAVAADLGLRLAAWFASWSWAAAPTPRPSGLEMALCWAAFALIPIRSRVRLGRRAARCCVGLVTVLMVTDVLYWVDARCWSRELRVTFLSVGQGDAAVVELPFGRVMVIDGGGLPGPFDPGARIVEPFLRSRKIGRVDVFVLSHPQHDHYEGLAHLAAVFRPEEFWSTGRRSTAASYRRLEDALRDVGTARVRLTAGATRTVASGVRLDVLHPPADATGLGVNDGSLVLRLTHGDVSILFTGDVEARGETALLARGMAPSTVLKVAHHGSRTSTSRAFLRAAAPELAVISAGHRNRFGFPAPAVLRRLEAQGVTVFRTDRDGAVLLRSNGRRAVAGPWQG